MGLWLQRKKIHTVNHFKFDTFFNSQNHKLASACLSRKNKQYSVLFKTVLSSGYILILLSIENILASLIETCQGWSRMRNVK